MVTDKFLVSRKDAARMLSISLRNLDYLIANKELAARRVGRRVLLQWHALEDFARRDHRVRVDRQAGQQ